MKIGFLMNREVRRVPMGFSWPLGEVWHGYRLTPPHDLPEDEEESWYEENRVEPPGGPGYQLWETTSEGSPKSPVFESFEELCAWCEHGATTFADCTATKERWAELLGGGPQVVAVMSDEGAP